MAESKLQWQAWAYGNLGRGGDDEFWEALGNAAVRCMGSATAQHKANLVQAFPCKLSSLWRRHMAAHGSQNALVYNSHGSAVTPLCQS